MTFEPSRGKKKQSWKPIFWPEHYVKENHDLTIAGNQLTEAKLIKYGKKATKLRTIQRQRALDIIKNKGDEAADEYLATTEKLARKMHNGISAAEKSKHNPYKSNY